MAGIGRKHIRADGRAKVTGKARYTPDLVAPGMLHARFLYAEHPHAQIKSIDIKAARSMAGVLAVLTQGSLPPNLYGYCVKDRTLFADRFVRYEGEIVAAVAALTPELADAACQAIIVDYAPIEAVVDPEAALAESSSLVHPEWASLETTYEGISRQGNDCGFTTIKKGDIEAGFREADEILEQRYVADMAHAVPIEPHAVLAEWDGDRVTVHSSTQVPFMARTRIAETLGIPESKVRVVVPYLGGGFGGKCDFHFEAHVAALARAAGRPVRLVFSRREEFLVPDKARNPMIVRFRTGITRSGLITALQATVILDTGAYASDSPALTEIATMMVAGPYRIPNLDIEGHTVYTNKTPCGSVRAPTGPEGCWALESHIDELARRSHLDPLEFRRRNLVTEGDEGPTGQRFERIGLLECVERAARMIGWESPRSSGEGIGIAAGWWFSAPNPTAATVKLNADGSATVVTGAQENGSGAVMGLALLVADTLGIEPENVTLVYQDTDACPWDGGSSGSQTTFNVGRAVIGASEEVRHDLARIAAERLEVDPEDLEFRSGLVQVRGVPDRSLTLAELATAAMEGGRVLIKTSAPLPPGMPTNNAASTCVGRPLFPAFAAPSFFAQAVRVRVDNETGVVRVLEVAAAHDFGHVINPLGAEGQVEGGIVMGLGLALTERSVYQGARQANPDLLDYKLMTAVDVPSMKVVFVEAPSANGGPYGSKGVGEPPCVPTPGAVANAIADAIGHRPLELPMIPSRIWSLLTHGQVNGA